MIADGDSKNGTCYTSEECDKRGGTNSGSCANGYGVCCTCMFTKFMLIFSPYNMSKKRLYFKSS